MKEIGKARIIAIIAIIVLIGGGIFGFVYSSKSLSDKDTEAQEKPNTRKIEDKDTDIDIDEPVEEDDEVEETIISTPTKVASSSSIASSTNTSTTDESKASTEAMLAVLQAEKTLALSDIDNAKKLVANLSDTSTKKVLNSRLNTINQMLSVKNLVVMLQNKVSAAVSRSDIEKAKDYLVKQEIEEKINALEEGTVKAELSTTLKELSAIVNDNTLPVISGINQEYNNQALSIQASDENSLTYYLNGAVVSSESLQNIKEEGTYQLRVVDAAFNERVVTFVIDYTLPQVIGKNLSIEEVTNEDIVVSLTLSEEIENIEGFTKSLEEENVYTKTISENGIYSVQLVDKAGNINTYRFEINNIDKIAPSIIGVSENGIYEAVEITAVDNMSAIEDLIVTIDDEEYILGSSYTTKGNHVLKVSDKVGNTISVPFVIGIVVDENKSIKEAIEEASENDTILVKRDIDEDIEINKSLVLVGEEDVTIYGTIKVLGGDVSLNNLRIKGNENQEEMIYVDTLGTIEIKNCSFELEGLIPRVVYVYSASKVIILNNIYEEEKVESFIQLEEGIEEDIIQEG